jgi:DNA-directed RNA polymerase specialized sigma24 family protein
MQLSIVVGLPTTVSVHVARIRTVHEDSEGDRRRVYRAAVMELPPLTRAIFLLHRAEGLDQAAIAERHAVTVDVVAEHVAAALTAIDRALQDAGY